MEKQYLFDVTYGDEFSTLGIPKDKSKVKSKKPKSSKSSSSSSSQLVPANLDKIPCETCPLHGCPVLPKPCAVKHPVMIVGAYPGLQEAKKGEVFVGNSGDLLHAIEYGVGFKDEEVYETNLVKCAPFDKDGKIRTATDEEIKACGWFLLKEIQELQPSLIVLCGELPLRYIFNLKYVSKVRGQVKIKGSYKFLTTFNPAHVSREKEDSIDRKAFERDIQSAYEIYKGISRLTEQDYKLVESYEELDILLNHCSSAPAVSIDLETYAPGKWADKRALDPYAEGFKIVSASLAFKEHKASCVLLEHPENKLDLEIVKSKLKSFVEGNTPKVGQSLKFDDKCMAVHFGWNMDNVVFDTEIASSLLDERKGIHNLERLSLDWLGERSYKYEEHGIGSYIPEASKLCIRNCTDADYTLRLYPLLKQKLIQENLYDYYMNYRIPAIHTLALVEKKGIPVDREYTAKLLKKYDDRIEVLENKILEVPEVKTIERFNIRSNNNLQTLFFDKLGLKPTKETKTGFSTDKDSLKQLNKSKIPVISYIQDYKELEKFKGTYLAPLLIKTDAPMSPHIKWDGRVHPTFTLHIAASGRLSCVNPNMQNIPMRVDGAKELTKCYAAFPGSKIGMADYNQMELRILAQYSQDPKMLEAFRNGEDLHKKTAIETSKIAGIEISRTAGKGLNFGIVYGMTEFGLADELGIERKVARLYLDSYLQLYEGVAEFQKYIKSFLRQHGYVTTMFGRKRWIKLFGDGDESDKRNAESYRKAMNTPIQGTATDICLLALIELVRIYSQEGWKSFPISTIHDAIMFEMSNDEENLKELNIYVMENLYLPWLTDVKLKVDWSEGKSWSEAKFSEKK